MRHCAGTYAVSVARGVAYLYRVLAPERATLLLKRVEAGWRIDEIRGFANRRVSKETGLAAARWLGVTEIEFDDFRPSDPTMDELFGEDDLPW